MDLGVEKINPESDQKQDAMLDASWMALGPILSGFWLQVGRQDEAKLAPKSNIIGYQIEFIKKVQTEWPRSGNKRPPPILGTTQNGPRGGIKGGVNPSLEGWKQCWNVGKGPEATSILPVAQGLVGFLDLKY